MLRYEDALVVIRRLLEVADEGGAPVGNPLVLLGGTAMAAWAIREQSQDVDLYIPSFADDLIQRVEDELRLVYGPGFRLDVTRGENVWGSILLRDITSSPQLTHLMVGATCYELQALRIEDLFLLKLASGRLKDREDLPLLAAKTSAAALVSRFNVLIAWHGDRRAILGFADALVDWLIQHLDCEPASLIQSLHVADYVRTALSETYLAEGADADDRE